KAVTSVIAERAARGIAPRRSGRRLGTVGAGHGAVSADGEARGPASPAPVLLAAQEDETGDWVPQTVFEDVISVRRPPDEVWAALGRIEEVAR
ncbi:hypothetical protein, partial [Glaesserella parasuis]|uniref:hypothetical protein n=1 Tax=Glaesserella parasuis TaxID=738 RepID=UPI003F3DDAAD